MFFNNMESCLRCGKVPKPAFKGNRWKFECRVCKESHQCPGADKSESGPMPKDFPPSPPPPVEEKANPGCLILTRRKKYVTEFLERRKLSEVLLQPTVPRIPPTFETCDIVSDLVEKISELTAMMEQLRRNQEAICKQLEEDMDIKCHVMKEEHEEKMRNIKAAHTSKMADLENEYKKQMRHERATAQEKLAGLQKEYKCLKHAFRVYQDSIVDEMEEKWLRKQAEWEKSARTELEKALLQQNQALKRKFEQELQAQKQLLYNNRANEQKRDPPQVPESRIEEVHESKVKMTRRKSLKLTNGGSQKLHF